MSGWQPIETAPKDGVAVLLWGGRPDRCSDEMHPVDEHWLMPRPVSGWWDHNRWRYCLYDSGYYGDYENPTHWMPLPDPPERARV